MESTALEFYQKHVHSAAQARARELRKAAKKIILDEDTYVDALDRIIQRDFFPDLPRLRAQLELLEALEVDDHARARAAYSRLMSKGDEAGAAAGRTNFTPASCLGWVATPAHETACSSKQHSVTSQTAVLAACSSEATTKATEGASLTKFLSCHSSEDNASFQVVIEKDNEARKRKYWWLQDGTAEGGQSQLRMIGEHMQPPARRTDILEGRQLELKPGEPLNQRAVEALVDMTGPLPPKDASSQVRETEASETRLISATANGCNAMSTLDVAACGGSLPRGAGLLQALGASSSVVVAGSTVRVHETPKEAPSTGGPLGLGAAAGAFPDGGSTGAKPLEPSYKVSLAYHQQGSLDRDERPTRLDFHAFSHKNSLYYVPDAHTSQPPLEPGPLPAVEPTNTRFATVSAGVLEPDTVLAPHQSTRVAPATSQQPAAGSYSLVSTPTIRPGVDASPIITWGQMLSTPQLLPEAEYGSVSRLHDPTPNPFKMPSLPPKDAKLHQLANDAAKRLRARSSSASVPGGLGVLKRASPRPHTSSATSKLSEAGRRMASAIAGIASGGKSSVSTPVDAQLRSSYTPKPTPRSTPKPTPKPTPNVTPRSIPGSLSARSTIRPSPLLLQGRRPADEAWMEHASSSNGKTSGSITDGLMQP